MVGSDDPFLLGFGLFSESKCEFQGVYPEDVQNDATRSSKRLFQDLLFFANMLDLLKIPPSHCSIGLTLGCCMW